MKIKLSLQGNIQNLIRGCGYRFERVDDKTGELVFSRPVEGASASGYPRFHIYLKQEVSRETLINLHLDQKKPIYKGAVAHNAEYDGEVVEREAERIKKILGP
jgi:hypothetical protein